MKFENLKSAAGEIRMPEEMKQRILHNCKKHIPKAMEEHTMHNQKNLSVLRKPAKAFALLAVCLSLSVTALASTGQLQGFFRDITNWQGAITGTAYEQATGEIAVDVTVNGDELLVLAAFLEPDTFPYREAEQLGIAEYKIVDNSGRVFQKGAAPAFPVVDGKASIVIKLKDMEAGSYTLVISAFASEKKADQPLSIHGSWECVFTK